MNASEQMARILEPADAALTVSCNTRDTAAVHSAASWTALFTPF